MPYVNLSLEEVIDYSLFVDLTVSSPTTTKDVFFAPRVMSIRYRMVAGWIPAWRRAAPGQIAGLCWPRPSWSHREAASSSSSTVGGRSNDEDTADEDFIVTARPGWSPPASTPAPSAAATSAGGDAVIPHAMALSDVLNEPLGVTRETRLPTGTVFSRFRKPVAAPESPHHRPGSRAMDSKSAPSAYRDVMEKDRGLTCDANLEDGSAPPTPSEPLPYDNAWLAERMLEWEVEGALDETWQDSNRAHIEDVASLVGVLKEAKVRDICVIDTKGKTSAFDYLVMGTCDGPRHLHLAAWATSEADRYQRVSKPPRKKSDELWECVPIGRIVVNLMQESYRDEVFMERKWAVTESMDPLHAAKSAVSEGRQVKVHGLWTLTLNLQDLEDFEVDYCKEALMSQR